MPPKPKADQRALVVGVSDYHDDNWGAIPAVAADVREMAKLLRSKQGAFPSTGVVELAEKKATRDRVLDALSDTFGDAGASETVFVYLAGHGTVAGGAYYYAAYDTETDDLAATGVPLTTIKTLFDKCRSRRVFLWLDFCHSGGILSRGPANEASTIRRALQVIQGRGKIIVAACTRTQSAIEDSRIGHGLFTHALLRGLRGDARSVDGEVTASSLYDFIDREVASPDQQPVMFGEMAGRIVLMHYPDRGASVKPASKTSKAAKPKEVGPKKNESWVMLGDRFFIAETVLHRADGTLAVAISPRDGDEEAALASLRPTQYQRAGDLPFAVNNEAHVVRVDAVETETTRGRQSWKLTLSPTDEGRGGFSSEMSYSTGRKTYTPDDFARMRVGRILLNDPPRKETRRGYGDESMLERFIEGRGGQSAVRDCVIEEVFRRYGTSPAWREYARLKAVFLLKASGTVEHVLELKIGAVRSGKVGVSFRGRRPRQYSNVEPDAIKLDGVCSVS